MSTTLEDGNMPARAESLALGGAGKEARGRAEEPLESLRAVAASVQGGAIPDCGHFIPEEQPVMLAERLLRFFSS